MSDFNSNLIFTLNVELPKGIKKQIPIYENSNSNEIAYDFCKENDLDYATLTDIKNQIDSALKKSKKNITIDFSTNTNNSKDFKQELSSINNKKNKNFYHKSQKLFPYQYTITENYKNKKLKENNSKKSLNNSINKSLNKSLMNNRKNIFERLFNDAEIKRISYRRSCHFSNDKNKNNNNKSYLTLNNASLNSSNYSKLIDENCDRTYQNSYVFKNKNSKLKNCTFRPNVKPFNLQQFAKPKIIKNKNDNNNYVKTTNKSNSYVTLRDRINNFKFKNRRINNLFFNENNNLRTENFVNESSNKNFNEINKINKISDISDLIFNLLKKNDNLELNSNTLKLDKIPNNIISIIIDIVHNISKKNISYNIDTFLKDFEILFNNLDENDKTTLNKFYNLNKNNFNKGSNLKLFLSVNNNKTMRNQNQNTFNFFNTSKKINSSRDIYKNKSYLDSGTKKKPNFYYIF